MQKVLSIALLVVFSIGLTPALWHHCDHNEFSSAIEFELFSNHEIEDVCSLCEFSFSPFQHVLASRSVVVSDELEIEACTLSETIIETLFLAQDGRAPPSLLV